MEAMRRAGRPRTFDPDEALHRALMVFWERGYEGASMIVLQEATGLTAPQLYRAFESKERLFERDVLIGKGQLKMLAGPAVGYGEGNRHPIVQKLAHATQELGVRTGDGRLAHVKLRRRRGARALDRREGQTLLTPEVELLR